MKELWRSLVESLEELGAMVRFLHLVGFDHETIFDAQRMEAMETRILARLGVADPYQASELVDAAP